MIPLKRWQIELPEVLEDKEVYQMLVIKILQDTITIRDYELLLELYEAIVEYDENFLLQDYLVIIDNELAKINR